MEGKKTKLFLHSLDWTYLKIHFQNSSGCRAQKSWDFGDACKPRSLLHDQGEFANDVQNKDLIVSAEAHHLESTESTILLPDFYLAVETYQVSFLSSTQC